MAASAPGPGPRATVVCSSLVWVVMAGQAIRTKYLLQPGPAGDWEDPEQPPGQPCLAAICCWWWWVATPDLQTTLPTRWPQRPDASKPGQTSLAFPLPTDPIQQATLSHRQPRGRPDNGQGGVASGRGTVSDRWGQKGWTWGVLYLGNGVYAVQAPEQPQEGDFLQQKGARPHPQALWPHTSGKGLCATVGARVPRRGGHSQNVWPCGSHSSSSHLHFPSGV